MSIFQLYAARAPFTDSNNRLTTQALKALQALVQSVGGSADGVIPPPANVTIIEIEADLTAIQENIDEIEAEAADNKAWFAAFEVKTGQIASDLSRVERKTKQPSNTELLSIIGSLEARLIEQERKLKKLETQCQSSLAR